MGTPEFAVPCLAALHEHCEVIAVITQPDKPRGRGQKLVPSPVKAWALEHGLKVFQPEKIKTEIFTEQMRQQIITSILSAVQGSTLVMGLSQTFVIIYTLSIHS